MRKKNNLQIRKKTIAIGLIGTEHGTGTTHLGFMLAVFLSSIKGYKTGLVESHNSECFRQAKIILENSHIKNKKIKNVISIFEHTNCSTLSEIMSSDYEYVVIDFGCDFDASKSMLLMCNTKIIVGSLSLWKLNGYVGFLAKTEKETSRKHWAYLATSPVREGQQYLKQQFGIHVLVVPYEPDPYSLGINSLNFLQELSDKYI